MSTTTDFDRLARAWLDEGPTALSDQTLDAALEEVHLTRQRRTLGALWRFPHMPAVSRSALAAIAVVAVVGAGAIWYLGRSPNVGVPNPSATAVPSVAPSAVAQATPTPTFGFDPYTWSTYTSEVYGFSTEYPPGWKPEYPAKRTWDPAIDLPYSANDDDDFAEVLTNDAGDVAVSIWRITGVDTGAFRESRAAFIAWAEEFCRSTETFVPCTGIAERAVPMCHYTPSCSPVAMIVPFTEDTFAFFGGGPDTLTVVELLRAEGDPEVEEYGGAMNLLLAFLDPLNVRPVPPQTPE